MAVESQIVIDIGTAVVGKMMIVAAVMAAAIAVAVVAIVVVVVVVVVVETALAILAVVVTLHHSHPDRAVERRRDPSVEMAMASMMMATT
jgi:hypothetical protein